MSVIPMASHVEALSSSVAEHFNSERMFVALLGGVLIVTGVNLYKSDVHLLGGDGGKRMDDQRALATVLFSLGWLVIALSTVYRHSLSPRGVFEPLNAKTLVAFASAIAVVSGALMGRMEHDANPTAPVSGLSQGLFLGGWLGIALVMSSKSLSPLRLWSGTKVALVLVGVLTTLAGVLSTRAYELETVVSRLEGSEGAYDRTVMQAMQWPKWLFGLGWLVIALGIGYHN